MYQQEKDFVIGLLEFELSTRLKDKVSPQMADVIVLVAGAVLDLLVEEEKK